jgi:hypothetical protein
MKTMDKGIILTRSELYDLVRIEPMMDFRINETTPT